MDRKEAASEIADQLGEHGNPGQAPRTRVEAQIGKMLRLMGEAWVMARLADSEAEHNNFGPRAELPGEKWRTRGGTFFQVARDVAMRIPDMDKRAFYSTFCWREPKPSEPKPAPKPKRTIPRPPAAPQHRRAPKRKPRPEVPVEYVRRPR